MGIPSFVDTLPEGSGIFFNTPITYSVRGSTDPIVQNTLDLTVSFPMCANDIPVIVNGVIQPGFSGSITANAYNGFDVSVIFAGAGGWGEQDYSVEVYAEDDIGGSATDSWNFSSLYDLPDETPPVVSNFSPLPGEVLDPLDPIQFDVTDNRSLFTRILVTMTMPDGVEELVHDGNEFNAYYAAHSIRIVIAGGFRYTVRRTMGWPGAPTVRVFAIDSAGNEAS